MPIQLFEHNGFTIAELQSDHTEIQTVQDAVDLLGNASWQGAHKILLHEKNLAPAFFDLKTGLAGEILQKFSNYNMRLAIIGDFSKYTSRALRDFIYESNQGHRIHFVGSVAEALEKLG